MEIGIIGLPRSGKTTVFNALSRGEAQTGAYSSPALTPNIGVVKVPDARLDKLNEMYRPRRKVPAEVTYIDIAMPAKEFGKSEGLSSQFLGYLGNVDALLHVVRVFENESIPHDEGSIDPERDISAMYLELAFSDLAIIERRLDKLKASLKAAKSQERDSISREQALLEKIKSGLENDIPVREQILSEQEIKEITHFQFLTSKPMLLLLNIGEAQLLQTGDMEKRFGAGFRKAGSEVVVLCGQIEMELSQLSDDEAQDFRSSMSIGESGLSRLIRISYALLGLISFFTVGSDEVRAWTIRSNTIAQKAAGKIHTDLERGFIRAEVIGYDNLVGCGSMAEARKKGVLRLEGKEYIVQDGDVMTILFNV